MKKIFTLLCLVTFMLASCSNDDDVDFDTIGSTFQEIITFTPQDGFAVEVVVPQGIPVFDSDVALVYISDPIRSAQEPSNVWEPLPRTLFFEGGGFVQFQYNFIFDAQADIASIELFLEGDDLNALNPDITDNQRFRIVIVPSEFAQNTKIDLSDFNAVQSALNLEL